MIQQAMSIMWVEDREWYVYQYCWAAEVDQMADGVRKLIPEHERRVQL
jgi:hypothetical protein